MVDHVVNKTAPKMGTEVEQSLRQQLREAQKLAALGTAASMQAHEYNNLFSPLVSYAQYALEKDDIELMRKTLRLMLQQHDAVKTMSERLLGLVRDTSTSHSSVDMLRVVSDAVECLGRNLSKDRIRLAIDMSDHLCVFGSYNQLQQVFFNLVLNARQALLDKGGVIKISATQISSQLVTIHVRDNGKGIKEADLPHIFTPFFSTKKTESRQEKKGLGLGLVICKEIIEEHDGILTVESIEGHGTTIIITLPFAHTTIAES